MGEIAASVIAVLGTLLGVGLTYVFQERGNARTESLARGERLRQERLDAYCGCAVALANYRRSLVGLWFYEHEGRSAEECNRAREQSFALRTDALETLFRVRMTSVDPEIDDAADQALRQIGLIHRDHDRAELDRRRAVTRDLIDAFVVRAREAVVPR